MINVSVEKVKEISVKVEKEKGVYVGVVTPKPIDVKFDNTVIEVAETVGDYEGDYDVTPKAYERVVLPTAHKLLDKNVTVQKVPYFETSNQYGDTVYIAKE